MCPITAVRYHVNVRHPHGELLCCPTAVDYDDVRLLFTGPCWWLAAVLVLVLSHCEEGHFDIIYCILTRAVLLYINCMD